MNIVKINGYLYAGTCFDIIADKIFVDGNEQIRRLDGKRAEVIHLGPSEYLDMEKECVH